MIRVGHKIYVYVIRMRKETRWKPKKKSSHLSPGDVFDPMPRHRWNVSVFGNAKSRGDAEPHEPHLLSFAPQRDRSHGTGGNESWQKVRWRLIIIQGRTDFRFLNYLTVWFVECIMVFVTTIVPSVMCVHGAFE